MYKTWTAKFFLSFYRCQKNHRRIHTIFLCKITRGKKRQRAEGSIMEWRKLPKKLVQLGKWVIVSAIDIIDFQQGKNFEKYPGGITHLLYLQWSIYSFVWESYGSTSSLRNIVVPLRESASPTRGRSPHPSAPQPRSKKIFKLLGAQIGAQNKTFSLVWHLCHVIRRPLVSITEFIYT